MAMPVKFDVAALIRTHQAGVWRYLRLLGCRESEADDLTQETFLVALKKPFEDVDRRATAAYLRKNARYLFLTSLRKNRREAATESVDGFETAAATSDGEADAADAAWDFGARDGSGEGHVEALRRCMEELDERMRQAIELRYREDRSRAEIAVALGMAEEGAKTLLRRAHEALKRCVERRLAR